VGVVPHDAHSDICRSYSRIRNSRKPERRRSTSIFPASSFFQEKHCLTSTPCML